ncbi:MAG: CsgG/HfaB family protein [Pseudomonadota bacterium]
MGLELCAAMRPPRWGLGLALAALVSGCAGIGERADFLAAEPDFVDVTRVGAHLETLPPASRKVDVAVYTFPDRTGQNKPSEVFAEFSRAVTQGAEAILIDALLDAGEGGWFTVIERSSLDSLATERNLIDQTNAQYRNAQQSALPPLRFAGTILEGGIINYDSNLVTGGAGARLLGVGANTEYRRDRISVALRAVSVSTGEVLVSVHTEKTVYSILTQGSVFRFVSSDEIFEFEAGLSRNEPTGIAVRQAIELAVYSMIMEGAQRGLWSFGDKAAQEALLQRYETSKALSAGIPQQIIVEEPSETLTPEVAADG